MVKNWLLLLCFLIASTSYAQNRGGKPKPLLFQADKNKVQVLQQRFEYALMEDDKLMLGDILIDMTQINFQLERPKNSNKLQVRFTWPADLIREGQINLKDNSGKTIFQYDINPKDLKVSKPQPKEENKEEAAEDEESDESNGLRTQIANLLIEDFPTELIDEMKYLPFIKFCILRGADDTRFQLCSQELYFSSQDGKPTIKARSSTKKTGTVEINRQLVGNQGMIYLNSRKEGVYFKAQARLGASLEVETRLKDVDFKDVVRSADEETITVTASGARPADETKVRKISETDWQLDLDISRPTIYLKGDGDIPLRQEFLVRGTLPEEKNRAVLSARSISRTYSSNVSLIGMTPEGTDVKLVKGDTKSKIVKQKKNQFLWTLQDVPKGKESRHYVNLVTKENSFIAGYDLFRGEPFSFGFNTQIVTPSGSVYTNLEFQWWIENLFTMTAPWAQFHWGLQAERLQQLSGADSASTLHFTNIEFLWRAVDGMNLEDETWGLSLPLQNIETANSSTMAFGFGAFLYKKPHRSLAALMDWSEIKFQYFLGSSGGDTTLSSAYRLKAHAYWPMTDTWYLKYGGEIFQYTFSPAAKADELQMALDAGVFMTF